VPGLPAVFSARQRISGFIRRTPVERSPGLSRACGSDTFLKLECWQRTGSFKARGAFSAITLLDEEARSRGLITASAGNHGQAVALAAHTFGARATVFVPAGAPETKRQRIRRHGAELRDDAPDYDRAELMAREHANATGGVFVHAFSDPAVVAGQGTVALELLEDLPALGTVLIPVGGGGLAAGAGSALRALRPELLLIGVQSTRTRAMYEAFHAGHVVDVPIPPTHADGLAGCTDEVSFRRTADVLDDIALVEEEEIAGAIRELHAADGVIAEGAGAVAAAALLHGRVRVRGTVAVLITGGNIDGERLARILAPSATAGPAS
jgi:threonine dehydratase